VDVKDAVGETDGVCVSLAFCVKVVVGIISGFASVWQAFRRINPRLSSSFSFFIEWIVLNAHLFIRDWRNIGISKKLQIM
jgi:hypothetical protein